MKKFLAIFSFALLLSACQPKEEVDNVTPPAQESELDGQDQENIEDDKAQDEDVVTSPALDAEEKASIEGQIVVNEPLTDAKVSSPLKVSGEAIGPWFFEGSFPVKLLDQDDKELATGVATSSESWMTEEMIPFEVTLTFDSGAATSGTLVLEKDNPSGEPQNAGKLEIPVKF